MKEQRRLRNKCNIALKKQISTVRHTYNFFPGGMFTFSLEYIHRFGIKKLSLDSIMNESNTELLKSEGSILNGKSSNLNELKSQGT